MKKLALMLVVGMFLSACANNNTSQQTDESYDNQQSSYSSACRLLRGDVAGGGRKVVYRCNGSQLLNSAEAREVLDGMPVSFGSGQGNAKGYRTTRQAARRFGTSDEKSCERAFVNALAKFKHTAQAQGHTRITDMHSYYDRRPQSGGTFDCEVGTFHGRVVFRAKLQ